MAYNRKRAPLDPCPVEAVLAIVSGKWKVRILYLLSLDELAFSEIRQSVGGIRQQVLSSVIASGVACRADAAASGESIYRLTPKGRELVDLLMPLAKWGNNLLIECGTSWKPPIPQRKPSRGNSATPGRPVPASAG